MNKIILLLITILSWGIWGFLNKLVLQKMHPLQMFVVGCCMGFLLLPVYAYLIKQNSIVITTNIWTILLCMCASLASTVGTIAYIYGIRTGNLGTISVLSCSYPVLTVALAVIFLGESLTLSKIIGVLLVISGVIVLGR